MNRQRKLTSRQSGQVSPITNYAEFFYGDTLKIRQKMVAAIREKRIKLGYSCRDMDELCFYGKTLPKTGRRLPTCGEFERNPELMNSFLFSLASGPLGLTIDRVLKIDRVLERKMTGRIRSGIIREMKTQGLGVAAAAGGRDVSKIPIRCQITIYVLFKILREISWQRPKRSKT